ncbi:unnamed protein product [Gongylonema pulchrum]|uniref:Uncharacterized protein n=1 Tax=Gongylonema pulchrum TaxID=637853 RepID=A0A3P6RCT7_9BILA|nr:unnamed protein product [Gongylonema pulchrum]
MVVPVSSQLKLKNDALSDMEKARRGEDVLPRRRKYDPFQSSVPSFLICCEPTKTNVHVSSHHFVWMARRYKLYGDDAPALCFYNSQIAEDLRRYDIAHTWRVVGLICAFTSFFEKSTSHDASPPAPGPAADRKNDAIAGDVTSRSRFPSSLSSGGVVRNMNGQDVTMSVFSSVPPQMASTSSDFFFGDGELNEDGLCTYSYDLALP